MNRSEDILNYAVAFATVSAGALMLSMIAPVLSSVGVQTARKLNLTADAHRMISLAKTYDAKAAAETLRQISNY